LACGEVKQRANTGISLSIVVAECAFVVAVQVANTIVHSQHIVVAECLVYLELHRAVYAARLNKAVRLAVGSHITATIKEADRVRSEDVVVGIGGIAQFWLRIRLPSGETLPTSSITRCRRRSTYRALSTNPWNSCSAPMTYSSV